MFGDDAFEPHRARMRQKYGAVALDFFGKLDRAGGAIEKIFQQMPPG